MSYTWTRIAIFALFSFFQTFPILAQEAPEMKTEEDKQQYALKLFKIIEEGPEKKGNWLGKNLYKIYRLLLVTLLIVVIW